MFCRYSLFFVGGVGRIYVWLFDISFVSVVFSCTVVCFRVFSMVCPLMVLFYVFGGWVVVCILVFVYVSVCSKIFICVFCYSVFVCIFSQMIIYIFVRSRMCFILCCVILYSCFLELCFQAFLCFCLLCWMDVYF